MWDALKVTSDITYTTNCPLCNDEVKVTIHDVPRGTGIIKFPVVCDRCKSILKLIQKKYSEEKE